MALGHSDRAKRRSETRDLTHPPMKEEVSAAAHVFFAGSGLAETRARWPGGPIATTGGARCSLRDRLGDLLGPEPDSAPTWEPLPGQRAVLTTGGGIEAEDWLRSRPARQGTGSQEISRTQSRRQRAAPTRMCAANREARATDRG